MLLCVDCLASPRYASLGLNVKVMLKYACSLGVHETLHKVEVSVS